MPLGQLVLGTSAYRVVSRLIDTSRLSAQCDWYRAAALIPRGTLRCISLWSCSFLVTNTCARPTYML
uniref:Secreted protein n=1 Tax=Ascaris lumbricoides TaxID=6252 RepID=A0A0M3HPW3_ASCLU